MIVVSNPQNLHFRQSESILIEKQNIYIVKWPMLKQQTLSSSKISIRNMVLLFFTILCWFASVMTFAQLNIATDIANAWQTIARTTITTNGEYDTNPLIDMSSGWIYIDTTILDKGVSNGQFLGINNDGYITIVSSEDMLTGNTGWWSGYWDSDGTNIRNNNQNNVGVGTTSMEGKLHIQGNAQTEIYLEETQEWSGTNINFQNTINTWMLWWYAERFYIGLNSLAQVNILTNGNVGIGTIQPQANLQVSGTFIAGTQNIVAGIYSSILGGNSNEVKSNYSSIGGGESNNVESLRSFIWWGVGNTIHSNANYSVIPGGRNNSMSNAKYSTIAGGRSNHIQDTTGSFAAGVNNQNSWYTNTFMWNSDESNIFYAERHKSFLINAPIVSGEIPEGGVGINVSNPQTALDVDGLIRTRPRDINIDTLCNNDTKWSMTYDTNTDHFYGCNGVDRVQLDN